MTTILAVTLPQCAVGDRDTLIR